MRDLGKLQEEVGIEIVSCFKQYNTLNRKFKICLSFRGLLCETETERASDRSGSLIFFLINEITSFN